MEVRLLGGTLMRKVKDFEGFTLICQDLLLTALSCGIQRDGNAPSQIQFGS